MSAHKNIDKICAVIVAITLVITILFCCGKALGIETQARTIGYENRLFDNTKVHTIDIVINDWDSFIETCENELYTSCNVVIDGELIKNIGIRGKGNTSLSSVKSSGSSRYSFKIEFDQYDKTKSYHGLDKLCLNNIIQDNTYMKDFLAYTLMNQFDVDSPLCSYAYITVNGEDWGLYLAVEAIEDSFLERNYGTNYGDLYKPDSLSFGGGGPGNGKGFNMTDFMNQNSDDSEDDENNEDSTNTSPTVPGGDFDFSNMPNMDFGNMDMSNMPNMPNMDFGDFDMSNIPGFDGSSVPGFKGSGSGESVGSGSGGSTSSRSKGGFGGFGGGGFGMGSDDVKLKYIDDDPDSYSNIFGNAKTTVNKADKTRLISSLKALTEQTDLENTVDVDEVIRYFVVHNFLCNGDSYTGSMIHNYYLYEKDGKLSMIPWDYNLAYGSFTGGNASSSVNSAIDTPVSGDMSDRPMISWIFDNEEYTELYHKYFKEFLDSVDLTKMIEDTAALIDEYVQKDPTKFCTYEEFQTGVEAIKKFCELRAESVEGQLNGTIPSTSAGQSADSSSLIDTTGLNTSDMGSMGGNRGGGNDASTEKAESSDGRVRPDKSSRPSGQNNASPATSQNTGMTSELTMLTDTVSTEGTLSAMPEGFDPSQFGGNMPGGVDPSQFGGNIPENFDPSQFDGNMPENFDPSQFGGGRPSKHDSTGTGNTGTDSSSTDQSTTDTTGTTGTDGSVKPSSDKTESTSERPSSSRSSSDRSNSTPSNFSGFSANGQTDNSTEYILLGASAAILLLGIITAALFKRRK